jgi:tRNA(His) 5'-end guanylyltransferase
MHGSDTLGDFCKSFEMAETDRRGDVGEPIYIRIDGSRFSRFTRGMERPYDERMSSAMVATVKAIMADYHSLIGYTQSDEISLVFYSAEHETHHGGKYQKIVSRLASKATAKFRAAAMENGLERFVERQEPEFDARAFAVPSLDVASKVLRWRELDATRNAIQMAAQAFYSHKALHGKNGDDMLAMLADKGVAFDDYPAFFRRGTFIRRVVEERMLTADELAGIPEKHRPSGPVQRHKFVEVEPAEAYGLLA